MTARRVDLKALVRSGDLDAVRGALCCGADPNALFSGQTALMHAAECGLADIAGLLLENGAFVDTQDRYGRTALHGAARFGHLRCCEVLVAAGARDDLRAIYLGNETPVEMARSRSHLDVVKLLLFGQADIKKKASADGQTKKDVAEVVYGDRPIATGGATGATAKGLYTIGQDAEPAAAVVPTPLPPPFAVTPTPIRDESRRLAPAPRYGM